MNELVNEWINGMLHFRSVGVVEWWSAGVRK